MIFGRSRIISRRTHSALALATITLSVLVGAAAAAADPTLKIGLILCLTGDCATDGISAQRGAEMARDEINERGGILGRMIELHLEDTVEAVSPARAVSAYKKLRLDPEIHFFIGPSWTPAGLALAPVVSKEPSVLMITPSLGVKEFHEAGSNLFNVRGVDESSSRALARLLLERGAKSAAIFASEQPWENSQADFFEDEFKKNGGTIAARVDAIPTATRLDSEVLKLVKSRPDVLVFTVVGQLSIAVRQAKKLGYNGKMAAIYLDDQRLAETTGALEGTISTTLGSPTVEFSAKFRERFHSAAELPAATAYDALELVANAATAAQSLDPKDVATNMLSAKYSGASGAIKFDPEGGAIRQIGFVEVHGGQLVKIQ